jgi:hypothetical protein
MQASIADSTHLAVGLRFLRCGLSQFILIHHSTTEPAHIEKNKLIHLFREKFTRQN